MATSRRDFLKLVGLAGGGSAGLSTARAESSDKSCQDRWGMLIDLSACIGCRKCEFACKQTNGFPSPPIDDFENKTVFEHRRGIDAENVSIVNRFQPAGAATPVHVKTQCMHCNDPACASACPVGAISKTPEGPVVYRVRTCIGCRYCMMACPFSMLAYTYDNPFTPVVRKCALCFDAVSQSGGVPACAKICPVEAITFGTRGKLIALARDKIRKDPAKYVDHIYGENEVGGTSVLYVSAQPFDQVGFRTDLGTASLPEHTGRFMSVIPFVVSIWPAVLLGAYKLTKRRGIEASSHHAAPGDAGTCDSESKTSSPRKGV